MPLEKRTIAVSDIKKEVLKIFSNVFIITGFIVFVVQIMAFVKPTTKGLFGRDNESLWSYLNDTKYLYALVALMVIYTIVKVVQLKSCDINYNDKKELTQTDY